MFITLLFTFFCSYVNIVTAFLPTDLGLLLRSAAALTTSSLRYEALYLAVISNSWCWNVNKLSPTSVSRGWVERGTSFVRPESRITRRAESQTGVNLRLGSGPWFLWPPSGIIYQPTVVPSFNERLPPCLPPLLLTSPLFFFLFWPVNSFNTALSFSVAWLAQRLAHTPSALTVKRHLSIVSLKAN